MSFNTLKRTVEKPKLWVEDTDAQAPKWLFLLSQGVHIYLLLWFRGPDSIIVYVDPFGLKLWKSC